ncbi:hypothetical protein ACHAPO_011401 [Fusarium lateritium]
MHPLRNILLLISLSGAAQAALAGAPSTESSGVEVAESNGSEAQPPQLFQREDDEEEDDDEAGLTGNDGAAVLAELDSRAPRVKCLTRGRPKKNCYHSQCPGNKQCKVNAKGNCVFKYTQKKRPFGCSQCLCYRSSI